MITAIVRYKLPPTIGKNECLAHFHKIAPGFAKEKGFIPYGQKIESVEKTVSYPLPT